VRAPTDATALTANMGAAMADNVSAVREAPELTARSAEEFPRPSQASPFIEAAWQARASAPCVTPSLLSDGHCTWLDWRSARAVDTPDLQWQALYSVVELEP